MTDFISQYRAAFEAVGRPLIEADSISKEQLKEAEQRLGHKLPKALRDFYRVAGNADCFGFRVLIKPDDLEINSSGRMVIC